MTKEEYTDLLKKFKSDIFEEFQTRELPQSHLKAAMQYMVDQYESYVEKSYPNWGEFDHLNAILILADDACYQAKKDSGLFRREQIQFEIEEQERLREMKRVNL